MTKVLQEGRLETTITAETGTRLKRNSTDLWAENVFFCSQVCDFSLEKANLPEMTIFTETKVDYPFQIQYCHRPVFRA